tara:strand:+ start:4735 stop:6849 length:2115 start_codon:yes stop_codon:yes gene_type:complete
MSKSISFTTETQTENKETYNLCHINLRSISLETSDLAQILYKKNINLFNSLNNSTQITSGKLIRHTILKSKVRTNKLSVPVDDSFESEDTAIAILNFDNGVLRPQSRMKFKSGKSSDIQKSSILANHKKTILDLDNPQQDDIVEARVICRSQELLLFQNIGIKTLLFIDNLNEEESVNQVSYTLELNVQTLFSDYIKHSIAKLHKSILFLEKYLNTINNSQAYDYKREQFKSFFIKDIMLQLGVDYESNSLEIDMSKSSINSSTFGLASKNLFNASLLLSNNVVSDMYLKTLKSLLPINTSSPEKISSVLSSFRTLKDNLDRVYTKKRKNNSRKKSSMMTRSHNTNIIKVSTKEKFILESDGLGYNIFSNASGFLKFTRGMYIKRINSEARRYYKNIGNSYRLPALTHAEKLEFQKTSFAFLTPIGIISGTKTIDTSRGIFSIDAEEIQEFKLKKAIKTSAKKTLSVSRAVPSSKLGSAASSTFNLSIGPKIRSALFKKREGTIDSNIDAKEYLGDTSYFVTTNPVFSTRKFSKLFKKLNMTNKKLLTKIIPRGFLRRKDSIKSISELSAGNKNSKFNKAVISNNNMLSRIPPQIRAMALQPPPKKGQPDVIKNSSMGSILQETQMNVFIIKVLVGFKFNNDGFYNVHEPIMKKIDSDILNSPRPMLAKAMEYEVTEIGITKDKGSVTIYNNLIYIRGNKNGVT